MKPANLQISNGEGLDLIFNDVFEIMRDSMGKDEMKVFYLTIILY